MVVFVGDSPAVESSTGGVADATFFVSLPTLLLVLATTRVISSRRLHLHLIRLTG